MMSVGSHVADQTGDRVQRVAGWPGRNHRLIERRLAANAVQTHPRQHAVVVAGQRPPSEFVGVAVEA